MQIGNRYTKKCHRYSNPGHAHELTFTCFQNRPFLSKERTCRFLIDAITAAREKHHFHLWAYVFMPNHVHLLICPQKEDYSISKILVSIKQPVARKAVNYLKQNNPVGLNLLETGEKVQPYHFWQKGGGYDRNITKVDTIIHSVRYIHNNPVRKGLVERVEDWYWSSVKE